MPLLKAKHIYPVCTDPIRDGAVVVLGDAIAFVGATADAAAQYPNEEVFEFGNAVIIPGLVNCHTHLELTAFRGKVDHLDNDFASWLLEITRLRKEADEKDEVELSAALGASEAIASGVTTVGDIARFGSESRAALVRSGMRGIVYQETEFSPDEKDAERDFEKLASAFDALRQGCTDLVTSGVSPHTPYTVSKRLFEKIAVFSGDENAPVSIHAAESKAENELMLYGSGFFADIFEKAGVKWFVPGKRSIEFLAETGILDVQTLLVHCVQATEKDIALISKHGASIAHCPKSNAKLGHGTAPLADFLENGLTVGFGTDSMAGNNLCDLFEEARFAAFVSRIKDDASDFIDSARLIEIATIDGARALGMDNLIGSLEQGKQADLAVISLDGIGQQPVCDVASTLVFSTSSSSVQMTMVAGEILYQEGVFSRPDWTELNEQIRKTFG